MRIQFGILNLNTDIIELNQHNDSFVMSEFQTLSQKIVKFFIAEKVRNEVI